MIRNCTLEDISDGKLYTENDMVRTDTSECTGCTQVCCHGMEKSIVLDPFDVHRMVTRLGKTFEQLLSESVEINIVDGIMLPNLKMNENTGSCSYLGDDMRCRIHSARPGVCRMFPLGRYWEDDKHFKYILQKGQCNKSNLSKIKVKKWIGKEYGQEYDEFIILWHEYIKKIEKACREMLDDGTDSSVAERNIRVICTYTLKNFFMMPYGNDENFFVVFKERVNKAYKDMGMN